MIIRIEIDLIQCSECVQLEQFRKQKAAKKASQSNNTTTQPVVSDSDGDVVDASIMSNGQSC